MLHQALDALLLYQLQELILILSTLFLGKLASQALQLHGTWVAQCVDGMADTIDETRLVVSLLVEHSLQVNVKFVYVLPVSDYFLQVMEHVDYLDVGTTMQRTFQATDTCGDRAVSICASGRCNTHSEGRVVTTTMLCLDDEQQVEHTSIQLGIVLMLQHVKEILGDSEVLARVTNVKTSTLHGVTIDVVSIRNDGRELGYQLDALTHQIVTADVVWVRVEGVHFEHATSQDVHDVGAFQLDDVRDGTVVERHVVVDQFLESLQVLLVWQLSGKQEVSHLLESESLLLEERRNEVVELVTTIVELTVGRHELAIGITLVAHNVTDIGQSDQHTRTILVTESTLHIIFLECLLVYLA